MATVITNPKFIATASATLTNSTGQKNLSHSKATGPAVGSGSGQVDAIATLELTITEGSPASIDLTNLEIAPGEIKTLAHVSMITMENKTSGSVLTPGGGSTPIFAAGWAINPNGIGVWHDAGAGKVVDSSHKLLQLAVDVDTGVTQIVVTIFGRTA